MQILLFDIDGTLIRSGGAGKTAMEGALTAVFGVKEVLDRVSYSGRTDPGIARELLEVHGIEPSDTNAMKLKSEYLRRLPEALASHPGTVLPGIESALRRTRREVGVGLLTGNIRAGAEIKLRHFGLWEYFSFGVFADGLPERDDVARRGLSIVAEHFARAIDPQNIWIIGDTPLDVRCARAIGARAVAVATGWHDEEELRAAQPDHFLPDFSHADELLIQWGFPPG